MKRFKNILLVCNGETRDNAVLERAAALAQENAAPLTVVEVREEMPANLRYLFALMQPLLVEHPEEVAIREQTEQLVRWVQPTRDQGISGGARVLVGTPAREIAREVRRNHYDLVVLAAEPKRGWQRWLCGTAAAAGLLGGSTLDKVLRRVDCDVLIVRPADGRTVRRCGQLPRCAAL